MWGCFEHGALCDVQVTCPCGRPWVPPFHDPHAGQSDPAETAAAASGGSGHRADPVGDGPAGLLHASDHVSQLLTSA